MRLGGNVKKSAELDTFFEFRSHCRKIRWALKMYTISKYDQMELQKEVFCKMH